MKILFLITSVISFACISLSCKTNKEQASVSDQTSTHNKEVKYRVIVSFASKGAGTSYPERIAFDKYIESHPKKPAYKSVNWGREGETDYCFTLKELSKKEQVEFIAEAKKLTASNALVSINENAISQHKGR